MGTGTTTLTPQAALLKFKKGQLLLTPFLEKFLGSNKLAPENLISKRIDRGDGHAINILIDVHTGTVYVYRLQINAGDAVRFELGPDAWFRIEGLSLYQVVIIHNVTTAGPEHRERVTFHYADKLFHAANALKDSNSFAIHLLRTPIEGEIYTTDQTSYLSDEIEQKCHVEYATVPSRVIPLTRLESSIFIDGVEEHTTPIDFE